MKTLKLVCAIIGALLIFGYIANDEIDAETYIYRYEPEATDQRLEEIRSYYDSPAEPSLYQPLIGLVLLLPAAVSIRNIFSVR